MRAGLGVVLLASVLSVGTAVVSPGTASAATTGVIVNTANDAWLSMRDYTAENTGWEERTSQFNFLVRHSASESVTGVKIDLNFDTDYGDTNVGSGNSCSGGNCGNETRSVGTNVTVTRLGGGLTEPSSVSGNIYSLVQVVGTFDDFTVISGDERDPQGVKAAVTLTGGDTAEVSATTYGNSEGNYVGEDIAVPYDFPVSIDNSPRNLNSTVTISGLKCDDNDTGGGEACEDADYRWRRVTDGAMTNANGASSNISLVSYHDISGDNAATTINAVAPAMSGHWILEMRFRDGAFNSGEDCLGYSATYSGGHACWFYLGAYSFDDASDPPTPTLSASATRPNVNDNVTFTAGGLVDGTSSGNPWGTLGNWTAQCYDEIDFTGLKSSFTQAGVNFDTNWGGGSPTCGLTGVNQFSIRYTQTFTATMYGTLRATIGKDDRSWLYVDNVLCFPGQTSNTSITGNCPITPGSHTLRFDYAEDGGDAHALFSVVGFANADDRQGIQLVDFDTRTSPGTSPDGTYDHRYVSTSASAPYAGFSSNQRTHVQSTVGLSPGVYTAQARSCDDGITICGDYSGTGTSASAQFRVSAAPVVSSPVVFVKRGESGVVVPSVSISDSDETASPLGGQASFTSTLTGSGVSLPNGIGQPGNSIGTRSCSAPTNASASDGVAGSQSCTVSVDADAAVGDYVVPFTSSDNNGAQSAAGSLTVRVVYEDNFTSTGVNCLPNSVTAGSRSVCTYTVTDLSRGQGGAALVGAAQSPPAGTVSASSSSSKTDFYPATPSCTLANPVSNTQTCQLSVVNRSPETVSMSGTYVPGSHSASAGGQNLVVSGCTASPVVYNTATLLPAGTPGVGSGTQVGVVVSGVGYNYRPSPGCNTTGGLWGQFATLDTGSGTQTFKTFESPLTGPGSLDDGRWTQDATIDPEFFASFLANATFKMYWASSSQSSLPGSAGYVSGDYSYTITPSPLRGARLQAEGESVEASMVIDADAEPEVDVLNVDGGVVSGLKDRVDAQVGEIASVSRLFFGFFGRAARDGELDSVLGDLDGGASLGDVGVQLGSRAEFAARYGHLGDAEFVDAVFVDVLGRAPTALERDGWVTALGGSATRAGLVVDVVGGAENLWRSEHRDYVVAAYAVLSDRTPSGNDVAKGVDALDLGLPKVSVIEDVAMGLADAAFWNQEGASASVDVDAAPQTISLGEVPSVVTDGESVVLGVSTSSGLWASVSVDGPCELVRGRTVEATGPGTCVVTVSQAGDGEYLAADDVVAEIAVRATQSIDFPALPESGVYGSTVELDAESSAGLVVSYRAEGACVVTGDELLYTTPGVCTVTATQVGDAEVAPAVEVSRSTTSVKAPLEVTLGELPAPAVVGRSVEVSAATSAGLDPVVAASGACTLAGSTLTYTAAGTCELVGSHPGDVNYEPAVAVTASVDVVAPVAQTITFPNLPAAPKVGAKTTLKATSSSGLAVEYTATGACTLTGSTLTYTEAGVECTVTAAQPGSDVVLPAVSVTRTTTPVPGTQTITFSNLPAAPKYGSVTTLNVKASSGLAVSLEVTGGCSLDGMALTYTAAGVLCSVTASQAGDGNWLPAVSVTRSTTPVKATQTITFPALPAGPVGSSFPLAATASSGLPVNYFAAGSCSVEDAVVTYTAAGTVCTVIATQPGDDNWAAANSVTRTRTPTKQAQTITISELPATLARNETTTVTATATSGLPVTITASGRCTINGSTLTMTNSTGKCTVKATQAGNTDWSAAPTLTRTITVT